MDFRNDEFFKNYAYIGEIESSFPIERYVCNISVRLEYLADDIDEVICGVLKSNGDKIDFYALGDILGFCVYDDPLRKKYKDQAEVDILTKIIQKRAEYHLLETTNEKNPLITLTATGSNVTSTKIKFQYANSLFTGFAVKKFNGLTTNQILYSFELTPALAKVNNVSSENIVPECFLDKELFDTIQNLCNDLLPDQNAKVLSFKEPHSYTDFCQAVTYKLYRNLVSKNEIVLAYKNEILLHDISITINESQNHEEKKIIARDIKFKTIWQNSDTIYNSEVLNLFFDKWDWILLLDKPIDWRDEKVWDIFAAKAAGPIWSKISAVAPVEEIIVQFFKRTEKWNWTVLSERLPDDLILSHITNPSCLWDFEVLSLKPVSFLRAGIASISLYNLEHKESQIAPFWNFYDITETLDNEFIVEAISVNAAINFNKLSTKSYEFVSGILSNQPEEYRNWDFEYFSQQWSISELLEAEPIIGKYISWSTVLKRIGSDETLIQLYLKNGRFNHVLTAYKNSIRSFTNESLIWDEWLIDYFDSYSLIQWQCINSRPGFEINADVIWNEKMLKKYIDKFSSTAGKSFLSTKIQSLGFIRQNISFEFDWVSLFDNLEKNESLRKEFSADFIYELREILPWKELSAKIKNDNFILNNVQRFKEYFDFEIVSERSPLLIQKLLKIPELIGEKWDWNKLTEKISDEFILNNLFAYSWDYSVLSKKDSSFLERAINVNKTLLWNWPDIPSKLSTGFLIDLLPVLNAVYGSLQPQKIQRFWINATKVLQRDYLKSRASEFNFQWDWEYITKKLFTKDEIVNNLENDTEGGYWDWIYLLKEKISVDELENKPLFISIQKAKSLITSEDIKNIVVSLITNKLINRPELLIFWMQNQKADSSGSIQLDWDTLSSHRQFYFTDTFIDEFKMFWNWSLLSAQKNIFSLTNENGNFQNHLKVAVKRRLSSRHFRWDWKVLSRNENLFRDFSILSDSNFIRKWDWHFISSESKFVDIRKPFKDVQYIYNRLQDFIDWKLFSNRRDIHISEEFLVAFKNKNWDWHSLSESYNLDIGNDCLIELKDRNWNWAALSKNKSIDLSLPKSYEETQEKEGILITLMHKEWDWAYLSGRKDLEISYHLLKLTKDKAWDFKLLTGRLLKDQLLIENYLRLLKDKDLDWNLLSATTSINFTLELIKEFEPYWNWRILSSNKKIEISSDLVAKLNFWDFIELSKRKEISENPEWIFSQSTKEWDWNYISSSSNYRLDFKFIERFSDKLNFSLLSANPSVKFTQQLLTMFSRKWNYNFLENNYSIKRDSELSDLVYALVDENAYIKFIQSIDSQTSVWKGYIYHFTHLTNAATVINSRRILSRNKALKSGFANAAGSVVENRHDAHAFARFYFRPQTPTQFYNENLGKDSLSSYDGWIKDEHNEWRSIQKSHYPQAKKLGLPRCPIPVFFRFKLDEVLEKFEPICNISNGNMQTRWAKYGSIKSIISEFNFGDLFSTIKNTVHGNYRDYIEYSQQEFLIKEEFDFSHINSVEIIVPDDSCKLALIELLEFDDPLIKQIKVNDWGDNIYHGENSKINVFYTNGVLEVNTDYRDKHSIEISVDSTKNIRNLDGEIVKILPSKIIAKKNIMLTIDSTENLSVKFIDELYREWTVFSFNKLIANETKPFLKRLDNIVSQIGKDIFLSILDAFESLEKYLKLKIEKGIFNTSMVYGHHGIAHTTRVLFWGHFLGNILNLERNVLECIQYSCIIHDLGKRFDKDDEHHGKLSANLYRPFLSRVILDDYLLNITISSIEYHSVKDLNCPDEITNHIIFKVLKDADALDRGRFANPLFKYGCDKTFLRNSIFTEPISEDIIWAAHYLAQESKHSDFNKPYKEVSDIIRRNLI